MDNFTNRNVTGIGVASTGHCHPKVVQAVQAQAETLVHAQQNIYRGHSAGQSNTSAFITLCPCGSR